MRAFIALDLPPDVRKALSDLLRAFTPFGRGIRWADPDQMHLTLKFLGEVPQETVASLIAAVTPVARAFPAFPVAVRGTGSFGSRDRLRVVWAGIEEPAGRLEALQRAVEEAVEALGFPREGRPFSPHLTLGRLREPSRNPALSEAIRSRAEFDAGSLPVDHMTLYRSTLTPAGPIYEAVHTWPLEAKP